RDSYIPKNFRTYDFKVNFRLETNELENDRGIFFDDVGILNFDFPTNVYLYASGTSMATPIVTGVAALLWSKVPTLSYLEVKNMILNSVDNLPQLTGKVKTSGRINAYKALAGLSSCLPPFSDIPCNYWAINEIRWIKERGITTGYPDGTFRPEVIVTREQMAAFIVRARYGENFVYNSVPYFSDVSPNRWSFKYVQRLYEDGITRGCGETSFCPESEVTRAQMAAFLVRALVGENFSYNPNPYFMDVPSNHWAFKYVQKLKELGITRGCNEAGTLYCPEAGVTRAQMAVFLYRAFGGAR
ncbi:MAG: S-layer homology domain-containing protein, partial [Thermodesulfobacteriaceae bacterium]|nr:S-layer homology domain-containing protein [Thermodesulfobacteriaceae bacterium]